MLDQPFLPSEKILVNVAGGDIALFRYGGIGATPVLLIHGVTSSNRAFQLFAKALINRGFTPYAVDLRGRGDSNHLPPPYGMKAHANDMKAVIDEISGVPIDVIGHSMGAFVAVALQGIYPNSVAKLTLIDGGIPLPLPPGFTVEQVMPLILGPALARLAMKFESREAYREYWMPQPAFNKGWTPAMNEYVDYDLRGTAPNMYASTTAKAVTEDSEDLFVSDLIENTLTSLNKEVLFLKAVRGLQNEAGGLYPQATLDLVLPKYPKLKEILIPDTNHYDILLESKGAEACAVAIYG